MLVLGPPIGRENPVARITGSVRYHQEAI